MCVLNNSILKINLGKNKPKKHQEIYCFSLIQCHFRMKHKFNYGSRGNNFEFDESLFNKEALQFLENKMLTNMICLL